MPIFPMYVYLFLSAPFAPLRLLSLDMPDIFWHISQRNTNGRGNTTQHSDYKRQKNMLNCINIRANQKKKNNRKPKGKKTKHNPRNQRYYRFGFNSPQFSLPSSGTAVCYNYHIAVYTPVIAFHLLLLLLLRLASLYGLLISFPFTNSHYIR